MPFSPRALGCLNPTTNEIRKNNLREIEEQGGAEENEEQGGGGGEKIDAHNSKICLKLSENNDGELSETLHDSYPWLS
ncbi:hypothetical protein TrLO_g9701 [Triparma laevis f. longispina]|uniref:Uncharacterized protein n=1 Tax=Triparma laevis f. longispina TaxID=1714387 RepID=A0A9W7FGS3_9STRA|nr:hypothetical protein TrLO_g9701 [Triparma laevis f. longispina]